MIENIKKALLINQLLLLRDIILLVISFFAATYVKINILPVKYRGLSGSPNYMEVLLLLVLLWIFIFTFLNLYKSHQQKNFTAVIVQNFKALVMAMLIFFAFVFILKIEELSRLLLFIFFITYFVFLMVLRFVTYRVYNKARKNKQHIQNVLIIGSKSRASDIIQAINNGDTTHNIIGCLDIDKRYLGNKVIHGVEVIGTIQNLKQILLNRVVDEVIFAMPLKHISNVDEHMLTIEEIGVKVRILPDWHIHSLLYEPKVASILFDELCGTPTLVLASTSPRLRDLFIKQLIDYMITAITFALLLPLYIIIGISIKLTSRGPVLFKQERIGLNGRRFILYKFRTMVVDAEKRLKELKKLNETDGPAFKIKKDPRIIPFIGTFLRKTSLDELPQLINILKGEMSLVGPRPPIPSEVEKYDLWQRRRLSMKPGLTCIWQASPRRNDISFDQWMKMDLNYIDAWSLKLDFRILWQTATVVVAGYGR